MVFDRRCTADSHRYPPIRSNRQKQSDGLRPPLQDYCVLLTRSFLMVLERERFPSAPETRSSGRCQRHLRLEQNE